MKQKYLIFGTGSATEKFLSKSSLDEMELVIGFVDNNPEKIGKEFLGKKIFNPKDIDNINFDKIIIASIFFNEIKNQLLKIGIPSEKIDTYINFFSNNFSQFLYLEENKNRLKNKNFSLISNSCCGSLLYKKLGLEYTSPFIGTFIPKYYYLKILNNFDYYIGLDLKMENNEQHGIIGFLDDVLVQFRHENNLDETLEKWNRRLKRMDLNNIFIHAGFNYFYDYPEQVYSLDEAKNIPFRNKLFIDSDKYYLTNNGNLDVSQKGVVDIISWFNNTLTS